MRTAPLKIALMWHCHMPYLKNSRGGCHVPWLRFYATKDYLDNLLLLKNYPQLKAVINLTPSLLMQIDDYCSGELKDDTWLLSERPADALSVNEKRTILDSFFIADVPTMIKPYRRYYQLYQKHHEQHRHLPIQEKIDRFSTEEFRDLQLWYNLTWIGQFSRQRPVMKALFEKQQGFSEADKALFYQESLKIMSEIISLHKDAWESGQIEISTSPSYYPIIPLFIDDQIARESNPQIKLPRQRIRFSEDMETQVRMSQAYFQEKFERQPEGMWPPEGAISEAAVQLLTRRHLRWIASDESVLAQCIGADGSPLKPHRAFTYQAHKRSINICFRDAHLSEAIAYLYSSWSEEQAVNDFLRRLSGIRENIITAQGSEVLADSLVSIIIPGESCWEEYPANGFPFRKRLFERLVADADLETVTFSDFLDKNPKKPPLKKIHPGSWINGSFDIWMGSAEDLLAFEVIRESRDFLQGIESKGLLHKDDLARAWRHIYIAESADWCRWYGNDHNDLLDPQYDELFRDHLMQVYKIAGREIPASLLQAIRQSNIDYFSAIRPLNFIYPTIDGEVTHFYEWSGAAEYDSGQLLNLPVQQTHQIIKKFFLGFDGSRLYLRLDFFHAPDPMYEIAIELKTPRPLRISISPLRGVIEVFEYRPGGSFEKHLLNPAFKLGRIFEGALLLKDLGFKEGDMLGFQIQVRQYGEVLESFPKTRMIKTAIPGKNE